MVFKQCSMCDRNFGKLEHLRRHERSHTRERPYECPTCKKNFSRSDVLFRHCKGHAQNTINRMKNSDQPIHQENQEPAQNRLDDCYSPRTNMSQNVPSPTPAATSQIQEDPSQSPSSKRKHSRQPQSSKTQISSSRSHIRQNPRLRLSSPGQDRIEALINAAQQLEPAAYMAWRSPSPIITAHPDGEQILNHSRPESMGPPIFPAMEVSSFSPTEHVASLDQWAFNPPSNRTPADTLQTWLFPIESEIRTPHSSSRAGMDGFFDHESFWTLPENQPSPSGRSMSIASRVPRERFQRVQSCWPSRNRRCLRLMPNLWQSLISCDCSNILSDLSFGFIESPIQERDRRNSQWGLDEECRSTLQDTLNNVPITGGTQCESYGSMSSSGGDAALTPSDEGVRFPPAEILDIALEMYLYYFHPTLPIIHIPTFSAKNTPRPLLLCMCLIGLSILGTAGATKFVERTFPVVLRLVHTELQTLSSANNPPHQQMRIIATSLLALNLASITGRKSRIEQAEKLYSDLITVALNNGLLTANEGAKVDILLDGIVDIDAKWKAWSKVECAKRIIFGLVEADCWWAGYLSISPIIRPEVIQLLPPSDYNLYHVNSASRWFQLVQRGARLHSTKITPSFHPTPSLKLEAGSFRSLLTLLLLRIYESNDRLTYPNISQKNLEPWRVYAEDQRSRDILPLLVNLSSSSVDALRTADLNSTVLWHASCMFLGANMSYFELAAGRSGPEPAVDALENISIWSQTPSARRSVLHAAHIYKLLFDRKVSDIVNPHSVVALFHAALVLGLYIFTLPLTATYGLNNNCIELLELLDWINIGKIGLIDSSQPSSNFGEVSMAVQFIRNGGPFSITGVLLEGGYLAARRTLLHFADLMEGMGRWKSRTFSQILHIMSDDLTDYDCPDMEDS